MPYLSLCRKLLERLTLTASHKRVMLAAFALVFAGEAAAQITFYESEGFRGRAFSARGEVANFDRTGFNDRASSVVIDRGTWQICDDAYFRGRCEILRRGAYESLGQMGMNNRISSVRMISDRGDYENVVPVPIPLPKPMPYPTYDYRVRPTERLYQAPVTSVRAVMGQADRRCWVERQQVNEGGGEPNVAGAIIGGILGGVLGHQVGGGRGKDVATALGAIGGAAIGNNTGRDNNGNTYDRDVRRCETVANGRPDYWDVSYNFRGVEHRLQMNAPPGSTITVNQRGEPRQ